MRAQFLDFFSAEDWSAQQRLQAEVGAIRDDVAPAMLREPIPLEAMAERYVRPQLRGTFLELATLPVSHYLERFGFRSDLLKAMYAVCGIRAQCLNGRCNDLHAHNDQPHDVRCISLMFVNLKQLDASIALAEVTW
jgi:hypothetical protein